MDPSPPQPSATTPTHRHRLLLLVVGALVISNLAIGGWYHQHLVIETGEDESRQALNDVTTAIRYIRNQYVDPDKIDYDNLRIGAIEGMLGRLDPFSSYFTPSQYEGVEEQSRGEFGGIGVVISMTDGHLTIVRPMPEGPAGQAGLQAKDRIVAVNGQALQTDKLEEAVGQIKGEVGTTVNITIFRPSTDESFDVSLERAIIPVPSVVDTSRVAEGIGYMRVLQFNEKTVNEVLEALGELDVRSLDGLILDMRYNPGGHLSAAIGVSSAFLPENTLVVYTEGRSALDKESEYATPPMGLISILDVPIVVLINGGSASAAEIVAGCLSDHGRAILVGTRSYGKGSVQIPMRLPGGSVMHLTTARYYTPSRRVIHGKGILPDLDVPIDDAAGPTLYQTGPGAQNDPRRDLQLRVAIDVLTEGLQPTRERLPELLLESTAESADTEPAAADAP